jgi:hypothetical protein
MLHMAMFMGNMTGDIFSGDWGRFYQKTEDVFSGEVFSGVVFFPKTVISTHFGMGTFFPKMDVLRGRIYRGTFFPRDIIFTEGRLY